MSCFQRGRSRRVRHGHGVAQGHRKRTLGRPLDGGREDGRRCALEVESAHARRPGRGPVRVPHLGEIIALGHDAVVGPDEGLQAERRRRFPPPLYTYAAALFGRIEFALRLAPGEQPPPVGEPHVHGQIAVPAVWRGTAELLARPTRLDTVLVRQPGSFKGQLVLPGRRDGYGTFEVVNRQGRTAIQPMGAAKRAQNITIVG